MLKPLGKFLLCNLDNQVKVELYRKILIILILLDNIFDCLDNRSGL